MDASNPDNVGGISIATPDAPNNTTESEIVRLLASNDESLWFHLEAKTRDLSYSLCEQLRLILEPTQMTRPKGDSRTGRRLGMKRIISYISSD
jgi:midasin (ATPase involved in ribosome maturation)